VIKGLPDGLNERCIEAAAKIKFIPATIGQKLNSLECGGNDAALDIDSHLRKYWKIASIQSGVAAAALQILRPSQNLRVFKQPAERSSRPAEDRI